MVDRVHVLVIVQCQTDGCSLSCKDGAVVLQSFGQLLVVSGNLVRYTVRNVDLQKLPHLSDFPLCPLDQSGVADLVTGMDSGHLLMPLDIRRNPKLVNEPYAIRSYFGCSLHGYNGGSSSDMYIHFVALDRQVENLWNLECRDDFEMGMLVDDRRVISLWDNEISFDDGHYTLLIPWREGRPNLPHYMYMAKCRFDSLRWKLTRTGMMSKYSEQIEQMIEKGYAKPVPDDEIKLNEGSVWYLPHHAVMNDAKPGKVWVVFDCAASQSGVSLNNQCMQGPDLVKQITERLVAISPVSLRIHGRYRIYVFTGKNPASRS